MVKKNIRDSYTVFVEVIKVMIARLWSFFCHRILPLNIKSTRVQYTPSSHPVLGWNDQ